MVSTSRRRIGGAHLIDNEVNMETTNRIRVVIVGGWSPGPLNHLQAVSELHSHEIIKPSRLNLYMPPFPGLWCCHPMVLFGAVCFPLTVYGACHPDVAINYTLLLLLILATGWSKFFFDCLVPVVVASSIEASIGRIHRDGLNDYDPGNVLIIGFSWGGCVVAEMIARGMVGQANQPAALLIAPTTSLVARVTKQDDVATQIARMNLDTEQPRITVVHGAFDTTFCPHQNRWNNVSGVDFLAMPDNHVFMTPASLEALENILMRFLQH